MLSCPACSSPCEEIHRFCPSCGYPIGQVSRQTDDPLIGRTLAGGYTLLELVGVGGMGRVYRAEQQALGRTVAVKIIHNHLLGDENSSARFITEARAASQLNHPNSVGVIDFGRTDDGLLYLVMEFLRGRDMGRVLNEVGLPSLRRTIDIIRQVLAALGEAHERGIIHRDLKPENIVLESMRGGGDFVKVVDFGLAKVRVGGPVTLPGIVCGTPDYMAPEQGRGDAIDARADLYSVGVILFLLLTGRLPFEGDSPTQVVLMHLTMPPPDPRRVAPERSLPDNLVEVCLKALSKDPEGRYPNADAFAEALYEVSQQGVEISGVVATVQCAACGTTNLRKQKFCGECGGRLTPSEAGVVERKTGPASVTAPDARPVLAPAARAPSLALRNRVNDLAWLEDRRADAHSSLVGARLVGDEGVGKTMLLQEFASLARSSGDRVVECGPDPWWADVGFWALRKAICELAELQIEGLSVQGLPGAGPEAKRGLLEIFGLAGGETSSLEPEERRYLAAEALRWALGRGAQLAGRGRVIVLIEDLQRLDGASRNAFADAVGEPPLARALVVGSHVPGFDAGWGAQTPARILSGFNQKQVREMMGESSTITPPIPEGRGVAPLHIDHLMRFARDGGTDPPERLADLMAVRVELVPPEARRVLQAVAVLGDHAALDDASALLGGLDVRPALARLVAAGLALSRDGTAQVAHPLLREVVLAMIPMAVRRELHTAALHLAQEHAKPLEVQAHHATLAQDAFNALLLLEQVASRAAARGDRIGSTLMLRRALDVARREIFRGELEDPTKAVVIFSLKLGEALCEQGNFTDADGVLREALDLTGPIGAERAKVLGGLAQVARGRSRSSEAVGFLDQAIAIARKAGARELLRSLDEQRQGLAS
jgi:serine/threonine-protein kinase